MDNIRVPSMDDMYINTGLIHKVMDILMNILHHGNTAYFKLKQILFFFYTWIDYMGVSVCIPKNTSSHWTENPTRT